MSQTQQDGREGACATSPGTVLGGRYRLERVLQEGSLARTFLARDLPGGARVVLKMATAKRMSVDAARRLEHEGAVLARLDAPELAPLVTVGRDGDFVYLVTRHVPGVPLDAQLRLRPLTVREALRVARCTVRALAHIHQHGIVHADVKPANVIVELDGDGTVQRAVLIDFGLARSAALHGDVRGHPAGTARYVSPEQAGLLDCRVDERSDLYSVGILLFECLAGHPPFEAETVSELLRQHLSSPPPTLGSLGVAVPGALDELVHRLIRKDPQDRYQSAQGVLHDLDEIAESIERGTPDPPVVIGRCDRRRTLTEPAFVGRAEELAALDRALDSAGDGQGGLVLVEGESGGGKTKVLDELARRCAVRGMWLLCGLGRDQAGTVPLQLLTDVAEGVITAVRREPDRAAQIRSALGPHVDAACQALPRLGTALGVEVGRKTAPLGPEGFGEARTLDALAALLAVLGTAQHPAVVLLDDCQWADELTVKLVARWWDDGRNPTGRTMVVVAYRSEEVPASHSLRGLHPAAHVRLRPFASAEVRLLVESMAGPVPPAVVERVGQLSDGNPFMASAVLRGLVESGGMVATPEGWRLEDQQVGDVRSSGEAVRFLTRRLELLPEATLRLLSAGAVLGKDFVVGLAGELAEQAPAEATAALDEARRRHIVWPHPDDGHCSFVHDKLREALLGRLTDADRQALHRLAARLLEQHHPDRLFDLAYHFDAGGEHERALPHALTAGAQARAQHALEAAERQYRIALRGSVDAEGPVWRRAVQGLGEVLMLRGSYDEAATRLEQASALADDDVTRAWIAAQLGELAFKRGDVRAGAEALERGLHLLHQRMPRRKIALAAWLVWELLVQVLHTVAPRAFIGRRSAEGADTALLAIHLYSRLAYAYWFGSGTLACGWSHLREMNLAERYPPGLARAQAYSEHAPVLTMLPFFRRGITYAQRSLAIRRDARDAWGEGQSLHFYGVVLYGASRYREAMERCREGATLLEQTGDRWEVNTANWNVAYCLYRLGFLREAVSAARAVHQAGVEIGDAQAAGISLSVWAKASGGRVPAELIDAELARASGDGHTAAEVLQARAVCLLHDARPDEAAAVLEEARSLVRARGLRQEYVAPVLPWLATARREQVLATQDVTPHSRTRLLREAQRAARRARRIARWYRNNLPHALRETALVDALRGRSWRARRHLDRSLAVASRQSAAWEHAQTLLARGQVGQELGWRGAAEDLAAGSAAMSELAVDQRTEQGDGPVRLEERAGEPATLSLADRFDTVLEVGWSITAALTRDAIFSAVRDSGTSLLRGERCVVLEVGDPRGEDVTTVSSEIDASVDDLCRQLVRTAVVTGRVAFLETDQESDRSGALLTGGETRSAVCAPVRVRDRVVGAFYASHSQVRDLFGAEEERLAEFIATLAGAALENAEGFGEVQALTRTLEERVEERTAQLAAANRELTHRAFHDPLTQLANRALFGDRVHHAITLRQRVPGRLAVLLVDLDDFKSVNDTWGHAMGDELLTGVASRLEQCLRPADTLARLGGDEFGILLEDPLESAAATAVAERILAALAAPFRLQGSEVWIHASVGVAVDEGHTDSAEALLRKADAAMYVAKERGKDRVAVFEPQMLEAVITRGQLRAALQVALEEHGKPQFAVHYQPIVELDSGRVTSVEALLRWQRPAGEVVTPDVFVPLAEEAGLIVALGGWVLECACRQVAAWQQAQPDAPPLGLHVNLSARQLQEPRLVGVVADLLADTGLVPDSLVLEITETALMRDPDAADAQLHALRELGVRLALDDFGTGYSALAYLQRFSLNLLKIDKSFVDGLGHPPGRIIPGAGHRADRADPHAGGGCRGHRAAHAGDGAAGARMPPRAGLGPSAQ